jgi:hypothetical protein
MAPPRIEWHFSVYPAPALSHTGLLDRLYETYASSCGRSTCDHWCHTCGTGLLLPPCKWTGWLQTAIESQNDWLTDFLPCDGGPWIKRANGDHACLSCLSHSFISRSWQHFSSSSSCPQIFNVIGRYMDLSPCLNQDLKLLLHKPSKSITINGHKLHNFMVYVTLSLSFFLQLVITQVVGKFSQTTSHCACGAVTECNV